MPGARAEPHHAFALETYIRGTVDVESVAEVASVTTDTLLRVAVLHGPHVELLQTPLSRVAGASLSVRSRAAHVPSPMTMLSPQRGVCCHRARASG